MNTRLEKERIVAICIIAILLAVIVFQRYSIASLVESNQRLFIMKEAQFQLIDSLSARLDQKK